MNKKRILRLLVLGVIAVLYFSSCATWGYYNYYTPTTYNTLLNAYLEQEVDGVFDYLGFPVSTSKHPTNPDSRIFRYIKRKSEYIPPPGGYGAPGGYGGPGGYGAPKYGAETCINHLFIESCYTETYGNPGQVITESCILDIVVDKDNLVKSWRSTGNNCRFDSRINALIAKCEENIFTLRDDLTELDASRYCR